MPEAYDPNLLNVLVAYPYMSKGMLRHVTNYRDTIRLVIDSGAFTAWKAGKPIQLDDYCRFIESLPVTPWRYFLLDVIGDPHATMRNYEVMLQRGFNPVPIFTRGEDPSVLDDYYKTSDVVGIGGLVGTKGNKGFINGIMKRVGNRKVHWLGFTVPEFVLHYRPYMCDSSSFDSSLRFGNLQLYTGRGNIVRCRSKDFITKPSQKIIDAIRMFGEDPALLARKAEWVNSGADRNASERLTYRSAILMNRELEQRSGSKVFFACSADRNIPSLHLALDYIRNMRPSLFAA